VFWQPFWKWQTSWKFWRPGFAPVMVTYHYVKFYVFHYPFRKLSTLMYEISTFR
jgi:hypothetical protein